MVALAYIPVSMIHAVVISASLVHVFANYAIVGRNVEKCSAIVDPVAANQRRESRVMRFDDEDGRLGVYFDFRYVENVVAWAKLRRYLVQTFRANTARSDVFLVCVVVHALLCSALTWAYALLSDAYLNDHTPLVPLESGSVQSARRGRWEWQVCVLCAPGGERATPCAMQVLSYVGGTMTSVVRVTSIFGILVSLLVFCAFFVARPCDGWSADRVWCAFSRPCQLLVPLVVIIVAGARVNSGLASHDALLARQA